MTTQEPPVSIDDCAPVDDTASIDDTAFAEEALRLAGLAFDRVMSGVDPRLDTMPPELKPADAVRWIARDGATLLEVQLWVQKGLEMLAAKDESRFGAPARALSREALARAEAGLSLAADKERLRAAALRLQGVGLGA